ncbi:hypothetical protein [Jiangella alkaliphila]|uniref:DUF4185 domain-containing protein n=1 Tax=Jiangella alkaliphila TaxID=419479 RepID=A0A1H2LDQ1_9ACTN|nr:hypothetical protein [Jiangella alkaliphila]SDU79170.1 hypothetical protein SAMN04488563_5942 [Jiangella alkaliphila]
MTRSARSDPIRGVAVGEPFVYSDNSGDNWIAALGDDGTLYLPSNDSGGFRLWQRVAEALGLPGEEGERLKQADDAVYDPDETLKGYLREAEALGVAGSTVVFNTLTGDDPYTLAGTTITTMPEFYALDQQTIRDAQYFKANGRLPAQQLNDRLTWKSSGCTYADGRLYWALTRNGYGEMAGDPHHRETQQNTSIIVSADGGHTWSPNAEQALAHPMFPGTSFASPYFIDYGEGTERPHGADRYVYAVSNNGFWDNGDYLVLGRVARDRLARLDGSDWEFLEGDDGSVDTSWGHDPARARHILERRGRLGRSGVSYLPHRGRYVTIRWHYPAGSGKVDWPESTGVTDETVWDFWEAPTPWGPWVQVGAHAFFPAGYYVPAILPRWQSAGRVYVLTAGDFRKPAEHYKLTVVPVDLR